MLVNHRERDSSLTWINEPPPPWRPLFGAAKMRWKQAPAGLKAANTGREPPFLLLGLSYMKDCRRNVPTVPRSELAAWMVTVS